MVEACAPDAEDVALSDEELTALALAADPDAVADDDAPPLWAIDAVQPHGLLPEWYMPSSVGATPLRGWRRRVVLLIIVSFLAIAASGLCSTYGQIVLA